MSPLNLFNRICVVTFLIFQLSLCKAQNFTSVAFPDSNNHIKLNLQDYCIGELQWQIRNNPDSAWQDIPDANYNDFPINVNSIDQANSVFRVELIMAPDTIPKYSYPFAIRIIEALDELSVADYYNRGFIFYSNQDTILSASYTGERLEWGCFEQVLQGADSTGIGFGLNNTQDIVNNCTSTENAAHYCHNLNLFGYSDWYLPSAEELSIAVQTIYNSDALPTNYLTEPEFNPLFSARYFWSSTENETQLQHGKSASTIGLNGEITNWHRTYKHDVLPVRNILNSDELNNTCYTLTPSLQFQNNISVQPVNPSLNKVLISYNGPSNDSLIFNWQFDGGQVLSGEKAGPYLVEYDDARYKLSTLRLSKEECITEYFWSEFYKVQLFESLELNLPEIYRGSVRWADFNNDALPDIILTGSDNTVLYINDGNSGFELNTNQFQGLSEAYVSVGDINNDEYLDFVVCGLEPFDNEPKTLIYLNNQGVFSELGSDLPGVYSGFVELFDFNSDGILDLVLSGRTTSGEEITEQYYGLGDGSFHQVETSLIGLSNSSMAIDDYDRDGDRDIIVLGMQDSIRYCLLYENVFGNFIDKEIEFVGKDMGDAAFFDYNNDGLLDLVSIGKENDYNISVGPGSVLVGAGQGISFHLYQQIMIDSFYSVVEDPKDIGFPAAMGDAELDIGDYNNDGWLDILEVGVPAIGWSQTGSAAELNYRSMPTILKNYEGVFRTNNVDIPTSYTNNGQFKKPTPHPFLKFESSSIQFGDYNQDGNLDIIREGRNDGFNCQVYRNDPVNANLRPSVPSNLTYEVSCDSVMLYWNHSTDDHTIESNLTYEIWIGTSPVKSDIVSKVNSRKLRSNFAIIQGLKSGTYFWGVKAVDDAKFAGDYSIISQFEISTPGNHFITENNGILTSNSPGEIQWFFQNEIIPDSSSDSLTATGDGLYFAIANYGSCGQDTSNILEIVLSDLSEEENNNKVLYPNPTTHQLTLEGMQVGEARIYTSTGVFIKKLNFESSLWQIDVKDFPNGVYLLLPLVNDEDLRAFKFEVLK